MVKEENGVNQARVISTGYNVSSRGAALANGATGHALDYDDTHFLFVGHPTSSALPTALALGEELELSIEDLLLAYMAGVEVSTRIGHILGYSHYNAGFHQTATSGSFGATIVASKLLNLSEDQTINALGLVSTRASGIKSQFGTMGKAITQEWLHQMVLRLPNYLNLGLSQEKMVLSVIKVFSNSWLG